MRAWMRRGSGQTGSPSTATVPASGRRRPSIISSVVVLPAPLGPRMPNASPWLHLETDACDGDVIAVALGQVVDPDGVHAGAGS